MSYTIKAHTRSDTKTILDPAGLELVTIQDLHKELNELLNRAESAEKLCDYWERRAKESPRTDWNRARVDAAISAMHAILSQKGYSAFLEGSERRTCIAESAVDYADALVSELMEVME